MSKGNWFTRFLDEKATPFMQKHVDPIGFGVVDNVASVAKGIGSVALPAVSSAYVASKQGGDPLSAGLLAGASAYGVHKQNVENREQADSQNAFQERMSSTAHQRQIQDLKRSGLNPLLSAGLGGASAPGGANIPGQNEVGAGVHSALEARRLKADIEHIDSSTGLNRALTLTSMEDAKLKSNSAKEIETKTRMTEAHLHKAGMFGRLYEKGSKALSGIGRYLSEDHRKPQQKAWMDQQVAQGKARRAKGQIW